jgi:hypothetical protein
MGCSRRARQQPHEDRSPVGGTIIAQTKSRLTVSFKSLRLSRHDIRRTILQPTRRPYRRSVKSRQKSAGKCRHQTSVHPSSIAEIARLSTNEGVSRQKLVAGDEAAQCFIVRAFHSDDFDAADATDKMPPILLAVAWLSPPLSMPRSTINMGPGVSLITATRGSNDRPNGGYTRYRNFIQAKMQRGRSWSHAKVISCTGAVQLELAFVTTHNGAARQFRILSSRTRL